MNDLKTAMFRKSELPALAQVANRTTREIVARYPKTARLFESLLADPRVAAQWDLANYMAVVKLGYNDHGPIHAQIVTAAAMQMMQLLHHAGVDVDRYAAERSCDHSHGGRRQLSGIRSTHHPQRGL